MCATRIRRTIAPLVLFAMELSVTGCGLLPGTTGDPNSPQGSNDAAPQKGVFYVATTGDDAGDGRSRETPFRTIERALRGIQPGSSILIMPGTFHESVRIERVGGGDVISIRGIDGTPILDGGRREPFAMWCERGSDIELENLEIRNYTDIGIGFGDCRGITTRNLIVHDNGFDAALRGYEFEGYGIHVEQATDVLIERNEVFANGPNPQRPGRLLGTGINTFGCTRLRIADNDSHDNVGGGILVEDGRDVVVENNTITGNELDATAEQWWDGALWVDGGASVVVRDNSFANNNGPAIQISDEDHQHPTGYVLERNTVEANRFGLYVWNFGTSDLPPESILRLIDNNITGNAERDVWVQPWTCPPPNPCD